jgi:hypothetical protein
MRSPLWYGFLSSPQIAVTEESLQLLAIPHRAMKADTYNGYHIPANATVLGNTWYLRHYLLCPYSDTGIYYRALLHDPEVYPDPETFIPERYEAENVPDPMDYGAFGYGRRSVKVFAVLVLSLTFTLMTRSCSGKNMAIDTVWIGMATILTVFEISKPLDENGKPIEPRRGFLRSTIK